MRQISTNSALLTLVGIAFLTASSCQGDDHEKSPSVIHKSSALSSKNEAGHMKDVIELGPADTELIAHGTVKGRIHITLTDQEIADLAKESPTFFNKIGLLGWRREGNTFHKFVEANGLDFNTENASTLVDKGRFALLTRRGQGTQIRDDFRQKLTKQSDVHPFTLTVNGNKVPASDIRIVQMEVDQFQNMPIRLEILIDVDFKKMKGAHNHLHNKGSMPSEPGKGEMGSLWQKVKSSILGDVHAEPMERCMDYNGPWSDGGNYAAYDPRAWRNFVCSDCDLAGAGRCISCWLDHLVGGCQANHGRVCSDYIGHPSSYHKHDWGDCAYCL